VNTAVPIVNVPPVVTLNATFLALNVTSFVAVTLASFPEVTITSPSALNVALPPA